MNIYATGMNPADSNALKRQPRVALFQAFVEMMKVVEEDGHNLTWRATKVGDEIPSNTDVILVSSMLPRSLNCPYALGAIYAMSVAIRENIPLVLYLTDWAFFRAASEFKSIAKAGPSYFFKEIGGSPQYNESPSALLEHGVEMIELCEEYAFPGSTFWEQAQVLVPRYTNWGNLQRVKDFIPTEKPIHTFDPTPVFLDYLNNGLLVSIEPMKVRKQQWILPSLLKDDRFVQDQNLRLPVTRFGPKGFEVLDTERDIQNAYRWSMGAICPPYPHEGSGWWRSRWIHSALAQSILLCGPKDALAAGPEYAFNGAYYESLSPSQADAIAQEQAERMLPLLQTDHGVMRDQIYNAIEGAKQ